MAGDLTVYTEVAREAARGAARPCWKSGATASRCREKGRADLSPRPTWAPRKPFSLTLPGRFPNHAFLGEEEGGSKTRPGPNAPPTWIVDPLDGTTNYVHDCPLYCVSIGLEIAGELVVGVIYDPSRQEMFWAGKGMGACRSSPLGRLPNGVSRLARRRA